MVNDQQKDVYPGMPLIIYK